MADLKVAIAGAGGKMGQANIRAVMATPGLQLHAAFDRAGAPIIGKEAGDTTGIVVTDDVVAALAGAEAIIDFTAPSNSVALAKEAAARGLVQLKGHRVQGGMRASIYNAMPLAGVEALCAWMDEFRRTHG